MTDQLTGVAGATIPCNCTCHGGTDPVLDPRQCAEGDCDFCEHGSWNAPGRVYLFPATTRLPCQEQWPYNPHPNLYPVPACVCGGRGWTAATDGWVWWRAAYEAGITLELLQKHEHVDAYAWRTGFSVEMIYESYGKDPEVAVMDVIEQVVRQIEGVKM